MKNVTGLIRGVLAHRAGRHPDDVRAWHNLERDLDLTPLELVLVTLEVEEAVDVELPAEELATLETVGDLFVFVTRAVADERRQQLLAHVA
jgi:acyl carrier protein